MRWITGDSFFMPVTRTEKGWRAWLPVILSVGGLVAVLWLGFHGTHSLEFDAALLPDSVRITYTEDRTHAGQREWLARYFDPYRYELYREEISAHATYVRFNGTLQELGLELGSSLLMDQFALCDDESLVYVRHDGRVILHVSGGDSVWPWDKTSFVIYSEENREPNEYYLKRARQ